MSGSGGLGYEIGRADGHCAATGAALAPGSPIVVALIEHEAEEKMRRLEFALEAWDAGARPAIDEGERVFATWRTARPDPTRTEDPLLDAGSMAEIFESLEGAEDRRRRVFRFVLALLLMRKKKLVFERREGETLVLRERGGGDEPRMHEVTDPGMDDEAVADAIEQIGRVLTGEEA